MRNTLNSSIYDFPEKVYEIIINNTNMNYNFVIASNDRESLKDSKGMFLEAYRTIYKK